MRTQAHAACKTLALRGPGPRRIAAFYIVCNGHGFQDTGRRFETGTVGGEGSPVMRPSLNHNS